MLFNNPKFLLLLAIVFGLLMKMLDCFNRKKLTRHTPTEVFQPRYL